MGNSAVKEVQLYIKTPIHLMFSKKTAPLELVDKFNQEAKLRQIKKFSISDEFKSIAKTYLYPVMLLQTIDSHGLLRCYFIGAIGTMSFAFVPIAGIAIAAKDNTTLFGTFLFVILPSAFVPRRRHNA